MAKILKKILNWREKQPPQSVISTETVKEIERKAVASGARDPSAVAGAAVWKTVKAKYREAMRKKKKG